MNRLHNSETVHEFDKHDVGRVLIVDDNPDNLRVLKSILEKHHYKTFAAISGELALEALNVAQPELILLDIRMPSMDGYEVCRRLKAEPDTRDIPVLFISALHDPNDKVKAFEVGGVDYIPKPFQPEEIQARVKTHLNLYRLQQELKQTQSILEYRVKARTADLLEANSALRASENRFKTLVSNIPGVTYSFDSDNHLIMNFASDGIGELTGYPAHEFTENHTRPFDSIIYAGDMQMIKDAIQSAICRYTSYAIEYRIIKANGETNWIYDRGQPVFDEQNRVISLDGIIFDINSRKQSEEALRKAKREASQHREYLARLARIQVAGELATSFAHELNQPLAAIGGYAQAGLNRLQNDPANLAKLSELLEKIKTQSMRAGSVIEHLRAMIKKSNTSNSIVNIDQLIHETIELAEIDMNLCHCRASIESEDDLPNIRVDKIQIQQVILNLIRNAIDAVCVLDADKKLIVLNATINSDQKMELTVTDNGKGISESDEKQLFEPFFTTKSTGMGIGLAICRTIIESHGGQIWFTPNPVGGSTFHLTLPLKSIEVS